MLSALKLVMFALFYAAVDSAPVMVHEEELLQIEKEIELELKEALDAAEEK